MGDGTTSVVILAGELLKESKSFIDEKVHPQIIMKGYRQALSAVLFPCLLIPDEFDYNK